MGFFKSLAKGLGSALGVYQDNSAQKQALKQAKEQQRILEEQRQQALILENSNEVQQVTQFDDPSGQTDSGLGITGVKKKKQATGSATSSLGLQY